jgi:hypothetical protein
LFDDDGGAELLIDDMEFHKAMRTKFGYRGMGHVITEVFNMLDTDGSGKIGFDELYEFVRGRRHSLDARNSKAKDLRIVAPRGMTLDNVLWNVEALRVLLQDMLLRNKMDPSALTKSWDRNGDYRLYRKVFLQKIQSFFAGEDPDLWEHEVYLVAEEAFFEVCQMSARKEVNPKYLDVIQLERWLDKPPEHPIDTIVCPKPMRLVRQQTQRRLVRHNPEAELAAPRVNTQKLAKQGILAAAVKAAERQAAVDALDAEVLAQWDLSMASSIGAMGTRGQRWERPPMQRWEFPKHVERPPMTFRSPRLATEQTWLGESNGRLSPPLQIQLPRSPSPARSPQPSSPSSPTLKVSPASSTSRSSPTRLREELSPKRQCKSLKSSHLPFRQNCLHAWPQTSNFPRLQCWTQLS